MTKEECIGLLNRYAEYDGMGIPHLAGCREAMRTAVELLQRPFLLSNLDEAAKEEADELLADMKIDGDMIYLSTAKVLMIALARFGAEWMAGQGVRAHCVESANPVSESSDARLHLITLLYEENKCTPYVRGGDNIDIIILKK